MFAPMMMQMFQAMQSAQTECPLTMLRTPQSAPDLRLVENINATARQSAPRMKLSNAAHSTALPSGLGNAGFSAKRMRLSDAAPSMVLPSTTGSELGNQPEQEQTDQLSISQNGCTESASQVSNLEKQDQDASQAQSRSGPTVAAVVAALADRKREAAKFAAESKKRNKIDTTDDAKKKVEHEEHETDDDEMPQRMTATKTKTKKQLAKKPSANLEKISSMCAPSSKEHVESAVEDAAVTTPKKGKKCGTGSDGAPDTRVTPAKKGSVREPPSKKPELPVIAKKTGSKSKKIKQPLEKVKTGRAQHKGRDGVIYCKPYLLKWFLYVFEPCSEKL
jgi:hypothetical protein